jgi:hypothetical protein
VRFVDDRLEQLAGDTEGKLALEQSGPGLQDEQVAPRAPVAQRIEQPRLADTGGSFKQNEAALPRGEPVQNGFNGAQFAIALDQI